MSLFLSLPSFYSCHNWDTGRLRNLHKVTEVKKRKVKCRLLAPAPVHLITNQFSDGVVYSEKWHDELNSSIFFCYRLTLEPGATLRDCLNLKRCWQVFWVHFEAWCMISFFIMSLIRFTLLRWWLQGIIMTLFPRLIFLFSFINCLMSAGHKYNLQALWKPKSWINFQRPFWK